MMLARRSSMFALALLAVAACGEVHQYDDAGDGGGDDDPDAGGGDTTPPDTTIQSGPPAQDNSTTVTFQFSANEPSTFACRLDNTPPVACSSPYMLTALTDGAHQLSVTATDTAGNVELEPAVHMWMIDSSTPDTQIDSGPTGVVGVANAQLTFSSPDAGAGATFECSLDASAFAACTSPRDLTALGDGEHVFQVRVKDATGNVDPSPAERRWRVDTMAPTVAITAPASPTNDTTPTFTFTTTGSPTVIECRMDADAFGPCSTASSHTPAALTTQGTHTLEVRVRDDAANGNSATASIVLDTIAPTATINTGVAEGAATNDVTPTWSFSTSGSPTTIECRVETVIYGACTVNYTAPTLGAGNHTFYIRLTDAAGNTATVTRNFSIDTTPPTISFTTTPSSPNAQSAVTYTWTSGGGVTLTECRALYQLNTVPVPAWQTCSSPHSAATFNHPGTITLVFDVRVRDAAGNITAISDTFSHYIVQ